MGNLKALKRRVAPRLLAIEGVTGVGTPGGILTVYVKEDCVATRREVAAVLEEEGVPPNVSYVVTGAFKAQ